MGDAAFTQDSIGFSSSIERVVVGRSHPVTSDDPPFQNAEGLQADVLALAPPRLMNGTSVPFLNYIGTILTTGPIGTSPTDLSHIHATNGVYEVRAITERDKEIEYRSLTIFEEGACCVTIDGVTTCAFTTQRSCTGAYQGNHTACNSAIGCAFSPVPAPPYFVPLAKPANFFADIRANFGHVFPHGVGDTRPFAPIKLIQTEGEFTGTIQCAEIAPLGYRRCIVDVYCDPQDCALPDCHASGNARSGILIRGLVDAPIDVDYVVNKCDIMGRDFLQPITVGVAFQGDLVAHGRDEVSCAPNCTPLNNPPHGFIARIDIGHAVLSPGTATEPENYFHDDWTRGFAGSNGGPRFPGTFAAPCLGRPDCVCLPIAPSVCENNFCCGYEPDWWLYHPTTAAGGGGDDSVIRAHHIHEIDIVQMRIVQTDVEQNSPDTEKKFAPRIEANLIDDLRIGDLREGSIWSGNYEWVAGGTLGPERPLIASASNPDYVAANDYASIILCDIGCMGPGANVWYDTCAKFVVQRQMLGSIYVPSLEENQRLWIGDRLGEVFKSFCDCVGNDWPVCDPCELVDHCAPAAGGQSTMGHGDGRLPCDGNNERFGHIQVAGWQLGGWLGLPAVQKQLKGQVIINASNHSTSYVVDPPDYAWNDMDDMGVFRWQGKVTSSLLDWPDTTFVRLSPRLISPGWIGTGTSQTPADLPFPDPKPCQAPYYGVGEAALGGGAVGVVPFGIHYEDSSPVASRTSVADASTTELPGTEITQIWFPHIEKTIRVRYYGAIKASESGSGPPVTIVRTAWNGTRLNVTSKFTIQVGVGPGHRDIVLRPAAGTVDGDFRGGIYDVIPNRTGTVKKKLLCDGLDLPNDVLVKNEFFRFVMWFDCRGDGFDPLEGLGVFDALILDCNNDGILDYCQMNGLASPPMLDVNPQDGIPDGCVHPCYTPNLHADFDLNGVLQTADIFAFLNAWFAGCLEAEPEGVCISSADFNQSGVLETADVFAYLDAWFGGCL